MGILIRTNTPKLMRKTVFPIYTAFLNVILTGIPSINGSTDTFQLYNSANSTITPLNYAVAGVSYKLITRHGDSEPNVSIARYLQYNTPNWYGIWVNEYNATTNATGFPRIDFNTIDGVNYVIWPYAFTFTINVTRVFYLYGLKNSNTVPNNPTTQNARIELTLKALP